MTKMNLDLFIVSYNRPNYLSQFLQSLQLQDRGSYAVENVHLFQDGPKATKLESDSKKIQECIERFREAFPQGHVHATDTNVGINGNYRELWLALEASEADGCIVFEDDLELSPLYLNVMNKLLDHALDNPNLGLVSAVGALGAPLDLQKQRLKALVPMGTVWGIHRWGWGITRDFIREASPLKRMYFDLAHRLGFADNGEPFKSDSALQILKRFITDMGAYHGMLNVQIDTMYDLFPLCFNRLNLCTYANFARSIGRMGVHFTEEIFVTSGHESAEQVDKIPDDFAWYDPEMTLDVLSLIRRYYTNGNINYNSGAFDCAVPYPVLEPQHIIKFLYEQILEWPLEKPDLEVHNLLAYSPPEAKVHPIPSIKKVLESDYDVSFGLLATGHRGQKTYKTPYGC